MLLIFVRLFLHAIVATGASHNNCLVHVRVYKYTNDGWIQVGSDIDSEADNSGSFGVFVSMSLDGTRVAVGGLVNRHFNGLYSGLVRMYEYDATNGGWAQLGSDIDHIEA